MKRLTVLIVVLVALSLIFGGCTNTGTTSPTTGTTGTTGTSGTTGATTTAPAAMYP